MDIDFHVFSINLPRFGVATMLIIARKKLSLTCDQIIELSDLLNQEFNLSKTFIFMWLINT